jgi:hypothetical protein
MRIIRMRLQSPSCALIHFVILRIKLVAYSPRWKRRRMKINPLTVKPRLQRLPKLMGTLLLVGLLAQLCSCSAPKWKQSRSAFSAHTESGRLQIITYSRVERNSDGQHVFQIEFLNKSNRALMAKAQKGTLDVSLWIVRHDNWISISRRDSNAAGEARNECDNPFSRERSYYLFLRAGNSATVSYLLDEHFELMAGIYRVSTSATFYYDGHPYVISSGPVVFEFSEQ